MILLPLVRLTAGVVGLVAAARVISRKSRRMSLEGKTALVCGASRGLGRAVALELGRRGCRVAICARSEADLERVRAELVALGVIVHSEVCDLRDMAQVEALVANVNDALGPIDVLVANAATISVGPIESMKVADFDDAHRSIFKTSLHAALAVLPAMRLRRTGTITFIASLGGKIAVPHLLPYSTAKFAEVGFAEGLRAESTKDGIHVLTVVPGLMRTGAHVHATFKGDAEKEYGWFGAGATAPTPMTIDADRAARRVADAIARGDDEIVLTPAAQLAVKARALTPGLLRFVMGLAGRWLPQAPATQERGVRRREGAEIERSSPSPAVALVRKRGQGLAERHHQTKATQF